MSYNLKKYILALLILSIASSLFSQPFVEQTGIILPGVSQSSVAWGDYNNDGKLDLLIAGSAPGRITRLYKNEGAGIFTEQASISLTGVSTGSVAWGDYNNDGFTDILLTGRSNTDVISEIYTNNGNGTFTKRTNISITGVDISTGTWADYNNDGYIDILITGASNFSYISKIYKNEGPPNFGFTEQTSISLDGIINGSVAWADYNKDGFPDILLSGFTGYSYISKIYKNNGDNSFSDITEIQLNGVRYGSVAWGDYNTDGYPDILLTGDIGSDCTSKIYKNNGDGSFSEQTGIPLTGVKGGTVAWGDYDNDGKPDILLTGNDSSNNPVSIIYHNNGNNTFPEQSSSVLTKVSQGAISWIDYDNDSDLDILITGLSSSDAISKIYRNDIIVKNSVPNSPTALISNVSGMNVILNWALANDNQTPSNGLSYNLRVGSSPGISDIVNPNSLSDGKPKLVTLGNMQFNNSALLKNLRRGTYYWSVQALDNCYSGSSFPFEQAFTISDEIQAKELKLLKSEGTGLSISWSHGSGQKRIVCVKEGTGGTVLPVNHNSYIGNTEFGLGTPIGTGWYCVYNGIENNVAITGLKSLTSYSIKVIEYQGTTGLEEYFTSEGTGNPASFETSVFTEKSTIQIPKVINSSVVWGDYDSDGDLDILVTGDSLATPVSRILKNEGSSIFTPQYNIKLTGTGSSSSQWFDFNNDGKLDILLTGGSSAGPVSIIYLNNGNGTFTEQTGISLSGVFKGSIACNDYDNDGYVDILLTGSTITGELISKIYRNTGITFTEQTSIQITGVYCSSVSWCDYNNDGYSDFLLTGFACPAYSCPVSKIYRNNGDGSFSEQTGISLPGVGWSSVAWGDYNNDGFSDILLSGYTSNNPYYISRIYKNNGDGTFSFQSSVPLSDVSMGNVAWGDYNNDGYLDVIITGSPLNMLFTKVFKNEQDGTFTELPNTSFNGVVSGSLAWGDYDNDGDLDLLLTGNSLEDPIGKLYRNDIQTINYKPDAPGNLTEVMSLRDNIILNWNPVKTDETPYRGLTYNLRVGKTSGGNELVSPMSLSSGYQMVTTTGNCQNDTSYQIKNTPGTYYWSVQAIDNSFKGGEFSVERTFTIDSIQASNLTVRLIDSTSLMVKWKRGNGQRCVVFCKNGPKSIAYPVTNSNYIADNTFRFGDQIGNTEWYTIYNGRNDSVILTGLKPNTEYSIQVVEYIGHPGAEKYYRETNDGNLGSFGTGLFTKLPDPVISATGSIAWGDYNNDGYLDILFSGTLTGTGFVSKIFKNNGTGSFSEVTGLALTCVTNSFVAWGDYNNDGYLDILISGWTGSEAVSKIFKNNGPPTFTFSEQPEVLTGVHTSSVAWEDYNNDGYLDLIITGGNTIGVYSKIYKNNGPPDFTFTEQTGISLVNVFNSSVVWGDYDNDGYPDILLSGFTGTEYVTKVYKNSGGNSFSEQSGISLPGVRYGSLAWGDYDNDGFLDILLTGQNGSGSISKLYKNNAGNSFSEQTEITLAGVSSGSVAWGDYDANGRLDILLTGYNSNNEPVTGIYRNEGNNSFSEQKGIRLTKIAQSSVSWADYDNDGDLDILASGVSSSGFESAIYKNNSIMRSGNYLPNSRPGQPTLLLHSVQPRQVRLEWTPPVTDETPAKSLSYNFRYKKSGELNWKASPMASESGIRRIVSLGNIQSNTSFTLKNLAQGRYLWQLQAVDQGYKGGEWSAVDSFEVKNVQAFYTSDEVCYGSQSHFIDQSVSTDGIAFWMWNFGDGTSSTQQNPVHLFSTSGNKLVKLIITSNGGVKDSLEKSIVIKPRPVAGFSALITCQGIPTSITNTTDNNGLSITSWKWNFGDGQVSSVQQPLPHGYLAKGDYLIKLIAIASTGCADSITKMITVAGYPLADITTSTSLSFCEGDSVTLSVPYNTDYIYNWKINGAGLTGAFSSKYTARLSGTYTVEIINSKGNCASVSSPLIINTLDKPTAPLILADRSTQFCRGDSVTLSVTNIPGLSYQWKLNNGSVGLNSNQFVAKDAGTYSVSVSNTKGCSSFSTNLVNILVDNLPVATAISLSGSDTFCYGGSVLLSVPANSGYSYRWKSEVGSILKTGTNSYLATKTGSYQAEIINSAECSTKTAFVNVKVKEMPVKPSINPGNYISGKCMGETPIRISVNNATTGYDFQWYRNGAPVSTSTYIESFLVQGYYYVEADLNGCKSASDSLNIFFENAPAKPVLYAMGPTIWFLASSITDALKYRWWYNGALIPGANDKTYVANQKLGVYNVSVGNANGCYTISDPVTIPFGITGIEDIDPFAGMVIYPNPTSGVFTIELENQIFGAIQITINDQSGKEIVKIETEKESDYFSKQIDLSRYPKGIYIIRTIIDRHSDTRKIIVK
jgi:PKD repeat protein